jgi:hypothetical protein
MSTLWFLPALHVRCTRHLQARYHLHAPSYHAAGFGPARQYCPSKVQGIVHERALAGLGGGSSRWTILRRCDPRAPVRFASVPSARPSWLEGGGAIIITLAPSGNVRLPLLGLAEAVLVEVASSLASAGSA